MQVKCCKSTCKVTSISDLLVCHHCFDKAFDKFYDMYTATWYVSVFGTVSDSLLSMLTSSGPTFFEGWKVPSYFSWTCKKRGFSEYESKI
jgi:hypothetical protein